jgi:cob(I)alamin adenosyltransferase
MSEDRFVEPGISLSRIYTKSGDGGDTNLVNGRRVAKDDSKVEAYGTVDELNCFVGAALVSLSDAATTYPTLRPLAETLLRVQHELFNLGSQLATDSNEIREKQPCVGAVEIDRLEHEIDEMNADLPDLPSFVLPGGSRLNVELHLCRAVCRRAERRVVTIARLEDMEQPRRYLNRLSDAFFVWSRWVCLQMDTDEVLWQPNQP